MKRLAALFPMFTTPTAREIAQRELADAQRGLLQAQSQQEYAKRIAEYQQDRVRRLKAALAGSDL